MERDSEITVLFDAASPGEIYAAESEDAILLIVSKTLSEDEEVSLSEIARMECFYLTANFVILLFPLQSLNLSFSEDKPFLGNLLFQRQQAVFKASQFVAEPNAANATGRNEGSFLAKFITGPDLAMSRRFN